MMDGPLLRTILEVLLVNVVLSGDNAVVIGLAARRASRSPHCFLLPSGPRAVTMRERDRGGPEREASRRAG